MPFVLPNRFFSDVTILQMFLHLDHSLHAHPECRLCVCNIESRLATIKGKGLLFISVVPSDIQIRTIKNKLFAMSWFGLPFKLAVDIMGQVL